MHRWFFCEDSSSSSDDVSLADDCESIRSVETVTSQANPFELKHHLYEMPLFKKNSGEEVLLMTELYLPVKRHRNQTETLIRDYQHIRRTRAYKNQLNEFYTELENLENETISDNLLKSEHNYLLYYLKSLENYNESSWRSSFEMPEEPEEMFPPEIKLFQLENIRFQRPRAKIPYKIIKFGESGKAISTDFSYLFVNQNQTAKYFPWTTSQNSISQSRIAFAITKGRKGLNKIYKGTKQNPDFEKWTELWGEKPKSTLKKHFLALAPQKLLKFNTPKSQPELFYESLPTTSQINLMIFEKSSEKCKNIKDRISRPKIIPQYSAKVEINDSEKIDDEYEESSDDFKEIIQNPNPVKIQDTNNLHHSKCAYKYHLRKINWSDHELQMIHRPQINIEDAIDFYLEEDKGDYEKPQEKCYSYIELPKADDLSLITGDFIVSELVEKYPLLICNKGMASKVYNYYNKEDVLFPYMGDIGTFKDYSLYPSIRALERGACIALLENNLFLSPIFSHNSNPQDFLLIRTSLGTWVTRSFQKSYTLGQQEPKVEVCQPKTKIHREINDRHAISAIYNAIIKNNSISNDCLKSLLKEMNYKTLKKIMAEYKLVKSNNSWTCERSISKEDLLNLMSPEEFCCYESMISGMKRLKMNGISIYSAEKVQNAITVLHNEFNDRRIKYLLNFYEEYVSLTGWNLSSSYLKGKKKRNFQIKGRGDPTCGNCGYSYEIQFSGLNSKLQSDNQKYTESLIRKALSREIQLLGNARYKDYSSESSDDEIISVDDIIPQPVHILDGRTGKEILLEEEECLRNLIKDINFLKAPHQNAESKVKKFLKRTIIVPTLDGKFIKKVHYTSDPNEIANYSLKKPVIPKIFVNKPKISEQELLKKEQEKEQIKIKRQIEIQKRKEERKLEKIKQKLIKEQEWKSLCLEKYNSGAVLFNTGTNSNVRCSRCNMIGHTKTNKKLCPAYVEEKLEIEADSRIVLNINSIPEENAELSKGKKKTKAKKKIIKTSETDLNISRHKSKCRRNVDDIEEVIIKIIEEETDKDLINGEDGLMKMLEKCENGYKWEIEEFKLALQKLYGEDYEYHEDKIEELIFKRELKSAPPPPPKEKKETRVKKEKEEEAKPKKKNQKAKKIELIEESDTLIININ